MQLKGAIAKMTGPREALGAHPVAQDAAADRQPQGPAHRHQHDEKGNQRRSHVEDRIMKNITGAPPAPTPIVTR